MFFSVWSIFSGPNLVEVYRALTVSNLFSETHSKLSEDLCNALNLQNRPSIFNGIKRACHQLVDQHFDLCLPSYAQEGNMQFFVERVIGAFPGYFANSRANEQERIGSLEAYTAGYLDRNQVPRSTTNKIVKKSRDRHILTRGDTAKVMRPRRRTLPRSRKKETEVEADTNDGPALDVLRVNIDTDLLSDVDIPVDVEVNSGGFFEPSPEPSPEPTRPDPLVEFLEDCCPSMVRCAQAFRRAGVNGKDELVGMSRWSEARLRNLLKKEDIARTALEEEALLIGFSAQNGTNVRAEVKEQGSQLEDCPGKRSKTARFARLVMAVLTVILGHL
ncbi:hypothetical protein DFH06DRAFT_1149156 [Mycena polygramma]|nr:hypothetical protein DFH06DRAFT_1149156 [Mycena polygramma]